MQGCCLVSSFLFSRVGGGSVRGREDGAASATARRKGRRRPAHARAASRASSAITAARGEALAYTVHTYLSARVERATQRHRTREGRAASGASRDTTAQEEDEPEISAKGRTWLKSHVAAHNRQHSTHVSRRPTTQDRPVARAVEGCGSCRLELAEKTCSDLRGLLTFLKGAFRTLLGLASLLGLWDWKLPEEGKKWRSGLAWA